MHTLNYIILILSCVVLYWMTTVAYDKTVRIIQVEALPIFVKKNCFIKHLDSSLSDQSLNDLSIYYSGTKRSVVTVNNSIEQLEDEKIQAEILKIVKDKNQPALEAKQPIITKLVPLKPIQSQQQKITQKNIDDTFKVLVKSNELTKNVAKSDSVFDVLED